ncbi:hypothetical protein, partial [Streptomyces sp. NRRL S-337]|uniref:hypothetical protein n=1 Tax=Streptomyces sp. NRRL S-337 TaxID=1463900 RepID=UPI00131AAF0D
TVEQGLDTAGKKLRNLAKNNKDIDLGAGRGLCAVLVVVAATAVTTAVTVTSVVVKSKATFWVSPAGSSMGKDEVVADLAKQLRIS